MFVMSDNTDILNHERIRVMAYKVGAIETRSKITIGPTDRNGTSNGDIMKINHETRNGIHLLNLGAPSDATPKYVWIIKQN